MKKFLEFLKQTTKVIFNFENSPNFSVLVEYIVGHT